MSERLRFERELADLGLRENSVISSEREQRQVGTFRIDFYDRRDFHFAYLGRLLFPSQTNTRELRLIDRSDLTAIYDANRVQTAASSDLAGSTGSGGSLGPEDVLFPKAVGLQAQMRYDQVKIGEQARLQSLLIRVDSHTAQQRQLDDLLKDAKRTKKEQGFYIVVEIDNAHQQARLYFLRATPVTSSGAHFTFNLGLPAYEQNTAVQKIRYVPHDRNKQVIGTVHTHYLDQPPSVEQTTAMSTKIRPGGTTVTRLVASVSTDDVDSAKNHQIVDYAIEGTQIHKATPDGKAVNGLKRTFDLLDDALNTFCGRTKYH